MTPLRAAVLLALEQACRANFAGKKLGGATDVFAVVEWGATVSAISARVEHPGLVRSSAIRDILIAEREAGRVRQDDYPFAHRWWPVGLVDKLRSEQARP